MATTTTYAERKNAIVNVATRLSTAKNALAQAKSTIARAKADIDAIPTELKTLIEDIETVGSANPDNAAYAVMRGEMVILLQERDDVSTLADTMYKAMSAVG